jgi:hypothetical protein
MKKKPETNDEMFVYIREHGYMNAMRTFGHQYVWTLTHQHQEEESDVEDDAG